MNQAAKDFYETTLYPQSEATADLCGEKSIIYTVLWIASEMCAQVKSYLMGDYRPTDVTYDALNRHMTTKYHMELVAETFDAPSEELVEVA
jgi:hypothetical protein